MLGNKKKTTNGMGLKSQLGVAHRRLSGNPGAITSLFHAVRVHARIAHLDLAENLIHPATWRNGLLWDRNDHMLRQKVTIVGRSSQNMSKSHGFFNPKKLEVFLTCLTACWTVKVMSSLLNVGLSS